MTARFLPAMQAQPLLEEFATWEKTTTIVIHGGSVFEYKGVFPQGKTAHGYFNLSSGGLGFEGHLNLEKVKEIRLQDKPHRGKESYAFDFLDEQGSSIFKVFLGRDDSGELLVYQVERFKALSQHESAYEKEVL